MSQTEERPAQKRQFLIASVLLLFLLICVEGVYKWDTVRGLYLYAAFLLLGAAYALFVHYSSFLSFLLLIPAWRITTSAFGLTGDLGLFFPHFLLLVLIVINVLYQGKSRHELGLVMPENRPSRVIIAVAIAVLAGLAAGYSIAQFESPLAGQQPLSTAVLILLFAAAVEELYFRGTLVLGMRHLLTPLLVALLNAMLFFTTSIAAAVVVLAYSIFLGYLTLGTRSIYPAVLSRISLVVFLAGAKILLYLS